MRITQIYGFAKVSGYIARWIGLYYKYDIKSKIELSIFFMLKYQRRLEILKMVLGTVIDWAVFRTLDLALGVVCWVTYKTGQGIYALGTYMLGSKDPKKDQKLIEYQPILLSEEDLEKLHKENELLKEQNKLLKSSLSNSKEKQD